MAAINKEIKENNFCYTGRVSISSKKNGHLYSLHKSSNNGLTTLFEQLCNLMTGQLNLSDLIPGYIVLYGLNTTEVDSYYDKSWRELVGEKIGTRTPLLAPATPLLPISDRKVDLPEGGPPKAILQSNIPYGNIGHKQLYIAALYPASASSNTDYSKALAFYKISNASQDNWSPIEIDRRYAENAILIIEWQMSFDN